MTVPHANPLEEVATRTIDSMSFHEFLQLRFLFLALKGEANLSVCEFFDSTHFGGDPLYWLLCLFEQLIFGFGSFLTFI